MNLQTKLAEINEAKYEINVLLFVSRFTASFS